MTKRSWSNKHHSCSHGSGRRLAHLCCLPVASTASVSDGCRQHVMTRGTRKGESMFAIIMTTSWATVSGLMRGPSYASITRGCVVMLACLFTGVLSLMPSNARAQRGTPHASRFGVQLISPPTCFGARCNSSGACGAGAGPKEPGNTGVGLDLYDRATHRSSKSRLNQRSHSRHPIARRFILPRRWQLVQHSYRRRERVQRHDGIRRHVTTYRRFETQW